MSYELEVTPDSMYTWLNLQVFITFQPAKLSIDNNEIIYQFWIWSGGEMHVVSESAMRTK